MILAVEYMLILSIALASLRLIRGPGLADRVVALDVIAILSTALMALYTVQFRKPVFLDVAVILALVSFVGTVAFAHFIERKTS